MGFSSGNYITYHEGNGYEWTETHSARYGSKEWQPGYVDPEYQEKLDRIRREKSDAQKMTVAAWNTIGQYAKIGTYVYPFEINIWWQVYAYDQGGWLAHPMDEIAYYRTSITIGKEDVCIYRVASADPAEPWLMQDEFRAQTKYRPSLNTRSRPWW